MPETTPTARCNKCGRPKSVGDKASLTQWIVCCNCVEGAPEAPAAEPVDICSKCKKRISSGRAGSFTQWVFRSDLCTCEVPEAMRPSFDVVEQEQQEWAEEEEELVLDGEPPFPLERYKPLMELGKGTSGHVYLCKDRLLEKKVAIKCLWAVTPEQLIGFQREARATSLLSHPAVVSVLDFGGAAGGAPYMVMEYVEGTSLFDYITENGPLPVDVALRVFRSVAEALKHAHERGVFHRDVKSANILLIGNNTNIPDVRVIDFGVAGVKQAIHTPGSNQGDTIVGTPAYMSPDQAQGLPYDQRSEIYSLGCVMYETLTGSPPFSGDTALETISKHAHEPAPQLADAGCDRVFSPGLESIVACCLEKAPEARFQSMKQFIDALQDLEAGRLDRTVIDSIDHTPRGDKNLKLVAITFGALLALGTIAFFAINVIDPETLRQAKILFSFNSEAESQKLTSEALEALESGDNDKAIALSTRAIELDDTNFRAVDTRGVAYFMSGDTKNALQDLNRIVKNSDVDEQTAASARFHRDVVYIALGKKPSHKTYIPSSNNTYVPSPWETIAFARWIKQDWRLLPLSAPGQVGGDPKNWPKDVASSPFGDIKNPKFKAIAENFDKDQTSDAGEPSEGSEPPEGVPEGSELLAEGIVPPPPRPFRPGPGFPGRRPPFPPPRPGFGPMRPGPGPRPGLGPGFRRPGMISYDKHAISMVPHDVDVSSTPEPPAEEIDEFNGVNNFAYAGPTRVKVTTLASDKDIDKIVADRKIDNLTFSRVPISPTVLSRIRVLPLKYLALQDYRVGDKDLEFLRDFKRLDHFVLSHGLGTGSFLANLSSDTMVDLVLRAMKNMNSAGLANIRKLKHLDTLQINSMEKIGNSDIRVATEMPELASLIFTPRFDKNPLYHSKRYELAVMPNSKFDYYDLNDLKKITSRPTLKKLVLDSDGLKDGAYDLIANSSVTELILQGSQDIKQANLKKLVKNKTIRELYFCGDVLHENSATVLNDFHNLSALYLFHTDVSKTVLDAMSKIKIGDLVIVTDQLNPESVQNLSVLKHIGRIKIVDHSIKLSKKDIDALREKLPGCIVKLKD